jgi:hypothetical protein
MDTFPEIDFTWNDIVKKEIDCEVDLLQEALLCKYSHTILYLNPTFRAVYVTTLIRVTARADINYLSPLEHW